MPTITGAEPENLVAEVEDQLGDKLIKARADFKENQSERQRLDVKRTNLATKKTKLEANRKECLIQHGKGVKGAAAKRAEAEAELASTNGEIEAVDAAIASEAELAGILQAQLQEMEAKLTEAKHRQAQLDLAQKLTAKKEEFIAYHSEACAALGELVDLSNHLVEVGGNAYLDQVLEDLLIRTSRITMIDQYKFTVPQSRLGLVQRIFEVTALVPPERV